MALNSRNPGIVPELWYLLILSSEIPEEAIDSEILRCQGYISGPMNVDLIREIFMDCKGRYFKFFQLVLIFRRGRESLRNSAGFEREHR